MRVTPALGRAGTRPDHSAVAVAVAVAVAGGGRPRATTELTPLHWQLEGSMGLEGPWGRDGGPGLGVGEPLGRGTHGGPAGTLGR